MAKNTRYAIKTSNEYIYSWLAIELVVILGFFSLIYYLVYKPVIIGSPDFDFYSKLTWGIFAGVMFFIFAATFMILNSRRYWVDLEFIEVWNIYRSKKKRRFSLAKIIDIKIIRMPILSTAFNFATLKITFENTTQKKTVLRIIGVKYPNELHLDLSERSKNSKKENNDKEKDNNSFV